LRIVLIRTSVLVSWGLDWGDVDHGDPAVGAQLKRRDGRDVGLALERLLE
jgi:hypothetical protein